MSTLTWPDQADISPMDAAACLSSSKAHLTSITKPRKSEINVLKILHSAHHILNDNPHLTTPTQHVMVGITRSKVFFSHGGTLHVSRLTGHDVGYTVVKVDGDRHSQKEKLSNYPGPWSTKTNESGDRPRSFLGAIDEKGMISEVLDTPFPSFPLQILGNGWTPL